MEDEKCPVCGKEYSLRKSIVSSNIKVVSESSDKPPSAATAEIAVDSGELCMKRPMSKYTNRAKVYIHD